jgi:MFS transporter, AAHS family, 4-hydroxybenzoate transporter
MQTMTVKKSEVLIDVRSELENATLGLRHWTVVLLLTLVTLFDGYDTFTPAYVIPYAIRQWHLPPSLAGLLVSAGLLGFMIGSIAVGLIADRIGRKKTLLGGLLVACLFDLLIAGQARSFGSFVGLRLLAGLGLGMLLALSVTLINELAPRGRANVLVGVIMVGWSGGGILAAATGVLLAPRYGWPALFWVDGGAIALAGLCALVLRESPRFLAMKADQARLRQVMAWLIPARASVYANSAFVAVENVRQRSPLSRLLAPTVRGSTLTVWLCAACSLFTIFGLSSWVPQTMIQRGEGFGASFAFGGLLQLMAVLGGLGCGWAADRCGHRGVMITSWAVAALAIAGLAVLNTHWTNILFVSGAGFFVMGAQPVLNNFTAGLYETEVRSTGVGVELGIGRLGGILGPYIVGWLKQIFPGSWAMFSAMALTVALCALVVAITQRSPAKMAKLPVGAQPDGASKA